MTDSRRMAEDPYAEDDYLGIRPPQPKSRQPHHPPGGGSRARHRSRTPPRRKERGSSGNVDEWDRHQDVMRQRLREKQEQSRRAQEMFREEHRRQSTALRGHRPQSTAQMPQGAGLSSVALATGSGKHSRESSREQTRERSPSSPPHRHHHHRGKKAGQPRSSGGSGHTAASVATGQLQEEEARVRKRNKRHRRSGSAGGLPASPVRNRSRSPLRSLIAPAAVHPAAQQQQQPAPQAKGGRSGGGGHRDRDVARAGSRHREGRRRRRQKDNRGAHRRASRESPSTSSSSGSASSSTAEGERRRRRPGRDRDMPGGNPDAAGDAHRRHRRKKSLQEELMEDIALLSEPDVGIGEEEEEMEEGEAGSDGGSLSPEERGEREEGEHEDDDSEPESEPEEEEEEEDESEAEAEEAEEGEFEDARPRRSRYQLPGRSKFDSASSSSSGSDSDSDRRSASSEDAAPGAGADDDSEPGERRRWPAARRRDSSSAEEEEDEEDDDDEEEEAPEVEPAPNSPRPGQEEAERLERELRRRAKPWYLPSVLGCRSVEEFTCLNRIEEGTYGVVYRARDKKTNEVVALKRLKMEKEREGFPITSLREINTLLKAQHPNIVTVREIVVGSNMDKIYIVMGYVEHDLKSLMEVMKEPFMIGEVKTLMVQLLSAVAHLHDNWILHRDLKTSNLLLSHKGILKVGDFGLAREYGSPLRRYTPVVVTLWYRAVELLLGTKLYSTAVDMWSVGCIFAELLLMKPLFPGKGEVNQLNLIFRELGTPNERIWPGFQELPLAKKLQLEPVYQFNSLRKRFPDNVLSELGFDLMNKLLTYCPERRINADDALKHAYFNEKPHPIPPHHFPTWPAKSEGASVHHKKKNSPTPPSGGHAYSKMVASSEKEVAGLGFRLTGDASKPGSGAGAADQGFRLKF